MEHIIVDAGSTDETISILKKHPHLHWTSEPDDGQTDAINKGFRQASGEWRMWLNADDYLLPGALSTLARLEGLGSRDIIYGDYEFVDEEKRLLRKKPEFDFDPDMLLFYGCYIPSTATFFHRRIFEAGHELDPSFKVCMDFEWFLKLSHEGFRFYHVAREMAAFRWHHTNASSRLKSVRLNERLSLQRKYLALQHRAWMGNYLLLRILFYGYKVCRVARRRLGLFP